MRKKQLWSKRILALMLSAALGLGTADSSSFAAFAAESGTQMIVEESADETQEALSEENTDKTKTDDAAEETLVSLATEEEGLRLVSTG